MVFHSKIFWGCLGGIFCWMFVWSILAAGIKQKRPYRNRFVNKFADNVEVIAILPLVLPALVYALFLRFFYDLPRNLIRRGRERRWVRKTALADRQVAGRQRRGWARQDLQHVRREKLPLIVEREQSSDAKKPSQNVEPDAFLFAKLSAELRIEIYRMLDYGTALRLSQANKFFYFERPYNSIDREQRMTFLWYSEAFHRNLRRRLACYECLRARSHGDFLEENRTGDFDRFGDRELERRCFDCTAKSDTGVGRAKVWRFKIQRWRVRMFHGTNDQSASV